MFGSDPRDLAQCLGAMEKEARVQTNFNQVEAREKFREYLGHDARFAGFDHGRLIDRVMEARSCGRSLDLDDPYLRQGGHKRPLSF